MTPFIAETLSFQTVHGPLWHRAAIQVARIAFVYGCSVAVGLTGYVAIRILFG